MYQKRKVIDPERQARKSREYRVKYPDIELRTRLKKFDLSIEEYNTLIVKQNNRCKLCGKPPKNRALAIDHCHITGRIRGLLCVSCNTSLGQLGDSVEAIEKVLVYLSNEQENK